MLHNAIPQALVIIAWAAALPVVAQSAEPAPLRTAVIDGSTVYSPPLFFAAYRSQLGQPLTPDSARAIAVAIADLYREVGYARPEVRTDRALAAEGILRVTIHEPYISRVSIEGTPGRHREQLEAMSAPLLTARPLRRDAISQVLASMRRIPGLTVTPTTHRSAEPAAYELVLQAEFSPVSGAVHVNNRGTDQIGPHFVLGQIAANDLLGWGEKLGLVFSSAADTGEYLGAGLFIDAPLGDGGTRGMAMVFRSDSAPNESPVNLTDEYARERVTVKLTHPLRQSADMSMALTGALQAEDLTVDRDGVDVRDDRLRVVATGLRTTWRAWDSTQLLSSLELRKGLDAMGAGLRADDLADDPRRVDFFLAQLQMTSFTRLNPSWTLRVDAFAQHSGHVLPDSERFKIGGERLGRGFEVAEIAGDRGLGAKAVVRRELTGDGSAIGPSSIYALYDIGAAWKVEQPGRESAATGGFGLALNGTRLSGYVEVVRPLTHADIEGKRSTAVFAEVSYRF
jgi:hemolysin activation/secretion protein